MTQTPTKPLFTARFAIVNTAYYTQDQIMGAFKKDLEAAGFIVYQTPSIKSYTAPYKLTTEKIPASDDDPAYVLTTMVIEGPSGKPLSVGRSSLDPAGSRPIIEKKAPKVTSVAWNLGPPSGATTATLADKLWAIRRSRIHNPDLYTGIGWTPIVTTWQSAPVKLANYPDRPPLPASLVPAPPKPVVKPPPVDPVITPPPVVLPPTPGPIAQASVMPWKWLVGGSAALLAWWAMSED